MDQTVHTPAPYFDPDALREQLTALWRESGGRESQLRDGAIQLLAAVVEQSREQARLQLEADGNGRRCAEGLALHQDELIRVVYDFTVEHVYRAQNPSAAERMAIAATGGYGRGMLAPGSDIDLLFLLPYKQTAWGESVVEYMLYLLWDLGFKVGHATRTVEQCIRLAKEDFTIRTALLDARIILGEETLYAEFHDRFANEIVKGTGREFIAAKLAERDDRHARSGASRYLVEPNVKDGKGGLRDLHTLYWLARYLYPENDLKDFVKAGIFSRTEYNTFIRCVDFLWSVRCQLHFLSGRAEERLSFDLQSAMAERLGYREQKGMRAVERFMKHYFLVAKDVGDLTRVVCSALEVKQLKAVPALNEIFAPMTWRRRAQLRKTTDFRIDNGRINAASPDAFKRDPVNLIRLFWLADKHNVMFHPEAIRLVRGSLKLIDKNLRENKEANRLFIELLTGSKSPENALRRMNEAGVLGRFIPAFGKVVAMMQFNMYHHFTVDEHLIRAIGILSDIEHGRCAEELPVSTEIIHTIDNRRALYVATLVHDIAKGRDEDHSIAGARIARKLCPRLGLTASETETVSWLVEHHLDMSLFAQSRDLNDPKTIEDFAEIVQSPERLKLLIVLTATDIRAVGPGVWNGWKGQLLRTLYYETQPVLTGGHDQLSQKMRVQQAQNSLRAALPDFSDAEFQAFATRHYPAYWLKTSVEQQADHARMIREAESQGKVLAISVTTDAFKDITGLTVFSPNHARLLSLIAGACAGGGANIVGAQISTTRDGQALDTIHLQREFDRSDDEERRGARIAGMIEQLLQGDIHLADVLEGKRRPKARLKAFSVEPQVVIDNTLSDDVTVLEVNGLDRPGLLHDLTAKIGDLNLDIASAHIATYGEKAVDVFYVTDLTGSKITSSQRQAAIRKALASVLQDKPEG
ncbi:MAG: [protein-PII] uridylyltransferase [Hyphomicrobiales bacterium]|nr:[protein-PII] uridylyltransferase [Hyphomicrobiales bacterium]